MTEVDYGGRGHRTQRETINLCVLGFPLPPYIKEQGGGRLALGHAKEGRNPPPSRSRIPPFLVLLGGEGERGKGEEEEKERGHPLPSPIQTPYREGAWMPLVGCLPSSL